MMSNPTFSPPVHPDSAMDRGYRPLIRVSSFNDGYEQVTVLGRNSNMEDMSPRWTNARQAEATYIIDFLKERKGRPFLYQPNGQGAINTYRCEQYNVRQKRGNYYDISASFKQMATI